MNLGFYMPTKVIVGKDCVRENSDVFKIGKKALIVTGKKSAKLSGALDDVKYALEKNNIEYVIFDKVMSNPTVEWRLADGLGKGHCIAGSIGH